MKSPFVLLTAAFAVSRVCYYWVLGVRFDIGPLDFYNQYLDPLLLKTDLWRSLFYLREQPPGFNLVLAAFLNWSPFSLQHSFHVAFALMGLASGLCLYSLMVEMRVNRWLAFAFASVFMVSPATVLYENWLFYAYPITFLFNLAALQLHRFLSFRKMRNGIIFFSCLAILGSFHSMFHLMWFVLIALALTLLAQPYRRRVVIAVSVPGLLLFAIYMKNFVMFGELAPGVYAFQTTNYAVLVTQLVPAPMIAKLLADHKISRILQIPVYESMPADYRDLVPEPPSIGVPAVDEPVKSTGAKNWNSTWMAMIGALYAKDALVVSRYYPEGRIKHMWANFALYFFPAEDVDPFTNTGNHEAKALNPVFRIYDYLTTGQFRRQSAPWISWTAFPTIVLFGLWKAIRWARDATKGEAEHTDPDALTIVFMLFNILYIAGVTIVMSHGDHNRYRDEVSGYFAVLLALLLQSAWLSKIPEAGTRHWRFDDGPEKHD